MLGWWFTVRLHTTEGTLRNSEAHHLASWETGVSGLRWIEDLVAQGIAQQLSGGGYSNRYLVPAGPVFRQLHNNMKNPSVPPKFSSVWQGGKFVPAAINACPENAQLVIEAWDQS